MTGRELLEKCLRTFMEILDREGHMPMGKAHAQALIDSVAMKQRIEDFLSNDRGDTGPCNTEGQSVTE